MRSAEERTEIPQKTSRNPIIIIGKPYCDALRGPMPCDVRPCLDAVGALVLLVEVALGLGRAVAGELDDERVSEVPGLAGEGS